jgi:hypothetical protein
MPLSPDPISDQQHSQTQSQSQMTSEPLPESLSSQPNDAMSSATSESLSLSLPPNLDSQAQQREYLLSLLFEKANQCISSSVQYDPSLRCVLMRLSLISSPLLCSLCRTLVLGLCSLTVSSPKTLQMTNF